MEIGWMAVAFIIVLGPLVFVHELGHFLIAKITGVHIEEFGFGYPPRLFKFWQSKGRLRVGNADVVIPRNTKLPPEVQFGRSVEAVVTQDAQGRNVLQRIAVVTPDETPASEAALGPGEMLLRGEVTRLDRGTEYTVNMIPLGGFVRPRGEDDPRVPGGLANAPKRVRIAILVAGAAANLLAAIAIFALLFATGLPEAVSGSATIEAIAPGSPAEQAGLQANDVILKADEQTVRDSQDLTSYVYTHTDQPITLTIQRGDQTLTVPLTPRSNPPPNQGPIGISMKPAEVVIRRYPLPQAIVQGANEMIRQMRLIASLPAQLAQGLISPAVVRPIGPVGISQLAAENLRFSLESNQWAPFLYLTASISIALGLTNLLPLPALDGGRILFVLIEAVRGRRVNPEHEMAIHFIGMAFLLALMLIITWQDLVNPVVIPR